MRKHALVVIAALALPLLVGACSPPAPREAAEREAPAPGQPALTIALLPERNVFEQKKRYEPIKEYLEARLGRPVNFKLLDSYQLIFSELLERRVDGAFFGSMNGTIAQIRGGVEILARPVDLNGVSTYSGLIFTSEGSGVTADPATWRGKRIALVNKVTTAGYLYPLDLLRRTGFAGKPEGYFSKVIFTGSHDAAILAVFNGEADVGACKNTVYDEFVRLHPEVARALTVLEESPHVPQNGLGVRADLPAELREQLREALVDMERSEEGKRALRRFQAQRFIPTTLADYEPVVAMARSAGIDLAQWPLRDMR